MKLNCGTLTLPLTDEQDKVARINVSPFRLKGENVLRSTTAETWH